MSETTTVPTMDAGDAIFMQAGRALDEAIAARVMRWRPLGPRWSADNNSGYEYVIPGCSWAYPRATPDQRVMLPAFSSDIAAAWRVVEQLRVDQLDFELADLGSGWLCTLWYKPTDDETDAKRRAGDLSMIAGQGDDETAPLAICHAALSMFEGAPSPTQP